MIIISVVVRVSYTEDKELQEVLSILRPMTKKYKIPKSNYVSDMKSEGKIKKAYIELK